MADESGPGPGAGSDRERVAATARLLARVAALGFLLGGGGLLALVLAGRSGRAASTLAFSLGALVFGFGLTAWAGTALLGDSLEMVHENLDSKSDWTAADSRRAMAVLAALGGGAMVGVVAATTLLGLA